MKKLILFFAFMLFSFFSRAQMVDYTGWQLSNQGCYGCASFYWKVTKTGSQYDVWFTSNSFYQNGEYASTYITDIRVFVDNVQINEPIWLLFKEAYTNKIFSFYTPNPQPMINLSWGDLKVY
jgi:hypothetical protein